MVTTRQTLEALLMPLAERMLPPLKLGEGLGVAPAIPDPRFDALRGETKWRHHLPDGRVEAVWDLDISLGAIVRTVVACGMTITCLGRDLGRSSNPQGCFCRLDENEGGGIATASSADTPEEAVARCLVALVEAQDKEGAT